MDQTSGGGRRGRPSRRWTAALIAAFALAFVVAADAQWRGRYR
jgi:hypothetical protein